MKEIVLVLVTAVAITLCIFSTPWAQGHGPGGSGRPALKVALLPILDSLPFHAAEETGTFRELGVEVKIIPVASAIERDQLMQSGQIDGMLTEMNTAASFNRDAVGIRIVRFARVAYPHHPLFRILSSPQSGIRSAAELPGVGIGVAKNTVIEYVTDRLLTAKGLKPEQIVKQSVPIIPERFQLLLQGRIKAAVLPDPLAKSAMVAGAAEVAADSEYPEVGVSVLAFSVDALRKKGEAVRLFLEGWDRAAGWINGHPEESRAVLLKRIPMPDNVREGYRVPPYPGNGVPDRRQWSDVIRWMEEKRLLDKPISYEDSVTTDYLKHPAVRPAS